MASETGQGVAVAGYGTFAVYMNPAQFSCHHIFSIFSSLFTW